MSENTDDNAEIPRGMTKKTYWVRIYFSKFVDVEVEAESEDEAMENAELPHLDWFDKHDTSEQGREAEEANYED